MARILVVDDDQDYLDSIRIVLEDARYVVDTALTPEQGIERIRAGAPDLLVLDVMMPEGYEGFGVARAVREDLALKDLPIVILSAIHARKEVPYRFAPDDDYLPIDVYLDKPPDPDRLVSVIRELLGEKREEPESHL